MFGNTAADSEFSVYYAAHYADDHHQVEKMTEGSRLVLIYNLIQTETARTLSANYHKLLLNSAKDMVAPIFSLLSQEQHAFLLQHEYTKQSLSDLSLRATKGQDRDLVTALLAINENLPLENKLDFIMTRFSYSVSSSGNDYGGGYYRHNSEECMEREEIESSDPGCDSFGTLPEQKQRLNSQELLLTECAWLE